MIMKFRILGLHCFPDGIEFEGRKVKVGTYPIGIEPEKFHRALATSEKVHAHIARLRARFRGVRVMVGIDRLDYIKALPQKLHAFARLLETHPEFRDGKCVLIQVAVPSREDVLEYQNLDRVVNELVGEVNGKYGGIESVPVHYVHKSVSFDELVALYAVADVTSTRDGMNLVSYEFIASQQGQHGVLLLSEFAGAAQSLNGAIIVNPWNTEELAQGMYEALTMPPKAKKINYDKLSRYVNKYTSERWGTTFVTELRGLSNGCENRLIPLKVGDILAKFRSSKHKKIFFIDYDGTLKSSHTLPELANPSGHVREIIRKLSKLPNTLVYIFSGRSRACLDSWFGDINVGLSAEHGCFYRHPPAAKFNEALLDLLLESDAGAGISSAQHSPTLQGQTNALLRSCSFPNLPILGNTSTAAQAVLQKSFAKNAASSLIPSPMPFVSPLLRRGNAGKGTMASMTSVSSLVGNPAAGTALDASSPISLGSAGSMATLRAPRVLQQGWLALVDPEVVEGIDGHRAWSNQIRPLFDYYTERTPGSFVEEKEVNLTWHYRKADPEFGVWQAAELHVNLEQILNHLGVSVILGNKTVEVRPSMTDKSTAARSVINDLTQAGEIVDFFCSIGDGKTDEVLFQYLNETFGGDTPLDDSVVPMTEKPPAYQVVTCTVGKKQTNAKWVLDNVKEVERFLDEFADTAGTATSAISPLFSDVSVVGDDRRDGAKRLRGESGKRIVVPPRPTADLPASELVDVAKKLSAARTALVGLGVHGIVEKK
ncbi:Trehalose-6-P synthase/phosphatase complex synthase subunit [Entophlyctis sp. JEL0112]|nr:Trehalose-6-P synthase/phosphatase complex synthase subunit [Entophlyctis sp. JEL0112]